jgi:hypothetical protein
MKRKPRNALPDLGKIAPGEIRPEVEAVVNRWAEGWRRSAGDTLDDNRRGTAGGRLIPVSPASDDEEGSASQLEAEPDAPKAASSRKGGSPDLGPTERKMPVKQVSGRTLNQTVAVVDHELPAARERRQSERLRRKRRPPIRQVYQPPESPPLTRAENRGRDRGTQIAGNWQ